MATCVALSSAKMLEMLQLQLLQAKGDQDILLKDLNSIFDEKLAKVLEEKREACATAAASAAAAAAKFGKLRAKLCSKCKQIQAG